MLRYTLCLLSATSLLACAAGQPEPVPPAPAVDREAAVQKAPPEVKQAVVAPEEPKLTTDPVFPGMEKMSRAGVQEALQPVAKLCADKDYDGAATALEEHMQTVKRGRSGIDFRVQVLALYGHSQSMLGEQDIGERSYRRVIALWGQPRRIATGIRRQAKDEADGDKRVGLTMDAFGEALFFVAEKRRDPIEQDVMPYYGGGAEPNEVTAYLKKDVARWLSKRNRAVTRITKDYKKVLMIKPETPGRWAVAATSRIAALHAKTSYELRTIIAPASWSEKGDSPYKAAGKPQSNESLRTTHEQSIAKLAAPSEEKARELFGNCVTIAAEYNVDNAFSKSCSAWLKADDARR